MKVPFAIIALFAVSSLGTAQQAPARPTTPTRPAAPAPVAAPARPGQASAASPVAPPRPLGSLDLDLNSIRFDAERFAELARDRAFERLNDGSVFEASQRAMEASQRAFERSQESMQRAAERATRDAQFRVNDLQGRFEALAPMATTLSSNFSGQISSALASAIDATANMSIASATAPLAPATWQENWQQERDPADSMFSTARDALNRGDWRRSADLFAQLSTKYPKSTRIQQAAYYEAFARYRIGTTDELKTALRVLNERGKASTNAGTTTSTSMARGSVAGMTYSVSTGNSNQNEVNVLATRIRGALAARGDQDAMQQLKSDAQHGATCDNEDMQVRSEALSALAQSDMTTATPMLRRVLEKKDPCSLDLRRRALSILLRRADTAATSAAIAVAKNNDETIDLRTDAISYLSRLPGDNALAALEDLMRTSTDRDIQRAAVRSLSNTDNAKARQSIRALIERSDVSEALRVEALNSFERDRGTNAEDANFLRSVYPKLQADRLKIAALAAISKNPGSENEQFVLAVARNSAESSDVRASAVSRMYRIPSISIADIGKLYDAADSRSMRSQIINVLSQRKEPETIDKLGEIAKSSTDVSARTAAISALNRKDDPRAKKLVMDIAAGTP